MTSSSFGLLVMEVASSTVAGEQCGHHTFRAQEAHRIPANVASARLWYRTARLWYRTARLTAGVALRRHRLYAYLDMISLCQGHLARAGRDSW
jgi:hypothetical protein